MSKKLREQFEKIIYKLMDCYDRDELTMRDFSNEVFEFIEKKLKEAEEQNKELRESIKIIEDMYLSQQALNKENEEKLK